MNKEKQPTFWIIKQAANTWLGGGFNSLTHPTPLADLRELNGIDCCCRLSSLFRAF
jgi:hypothetical protein